MSTQAQPTMFNPFDGILLASGSGVFATFMLALNSSPVLAAVITGSFMLVGKLIELWWKSRTDKRIADLKRQLRAAESESVFQQYCTRSLWHRGPCNGLPRSNCKVYSPKL